MYAGLLAYANTPGIDSGYWLVPIRLRCCFCDLFTNQI